MLRVAPSAKEVTYNPTVEQLYAPEVWPLILVSFQDNSFPYGG